jgi:flavin reductase (DIM6/NTAB) family NADH-FMN oxidoreductase RutF
MLSFLDASNISQLDQRFRTNFINCLSGFKSLNLIGSVNQLQQTNLAIFNSVFHLGANPPLMGCIFRPDSVERHTLSNIESLGYFTINHVNQVDYPKAHQTSARYPQNVSEFDAIGLIPEFKNNFPAPFVKESKIQIGLKFQQRIDIPINNTSLIIGEILQVYYPQNCLCSDGYLDLEKAGTITGTGLDGYHNTQRIERLSYAKPELPLISLPLNYLE